MTDTKASESMTARTSDWVARTTAAPEAPAAPATRGWSRTALAYQSATALDRLTGSARDAALERHFEQFPPAIGSRATTCRI
jgi:hypothetical protein